MNLRGPMILELLQRLDRQNLEASRQCIIQMGKTYICHKDNHVQRKVSK